MKIVSEKEYESMWKEFDGMTFTPFTELIEEIEEIEDEFGNKREQKIFKYKIIKTADEVYQEYLQEKDKPIVEEPSIEEKVQLLEDDNANLLFDLADKDARIKQLENDFADLLLNLGGDK